MDSEGGVLAGEWFLAFEWYGENSNCKNWGIKCLLTSTMDKPIRKHFRLVLIAQRKRKSVRVSLAVFTDVNYLLDPEDRQIWRQCTELRSHPVNTDNQEFRLANVTQSKCQRVGDTSNNSFYSGYSAYKIGFEKIERVQISCVNSWLSFPRHLVTHSYASINGPLWTLTEIEKTKLVSRMGWICLWV